MLIKLLKIKSSMQQVEMPGSTAKDPPLDNWYFTVSNFVCFLKIACIVYVLYVNFMDIVKES